MNKTIRDMDDHETQEHRLPRCDVRSQPFFPIDPPFVVMVDAEEDSEYDASDDDKLTDEYF